MVLCRPILKTEDSVLTIPGDVTSLVFSPTSLEDTALGGFGGSEFWLYHENAFAPLVSETSE